MRLPFGRRPPEAASAADPQRSPPTERELQAQALVQALRQARRDRDAAKERLADQVWESPEMTSRIREARAEVVRWDKEVARLEAALHRGGGAPPAAAPRRPAAANPARSPTAGAAVPGPPRPSAASRHPANSQEADFAAAIAGDADGLHRLKLTYLSSIVDPGSAGAPAAATAAVARLVHDRAALERARAALDPAAVKRARPDLSAEARDLMATKAELIRRLLEAAAARRRRTETVE